MARTTAPPTGHRRWAVILPLAGAVLIVLYAVLSAAVFSAYLIAGRHLMLGPSLDGRLTSASLPQVSAGQVPPMDTEYLTDFPLWLRWMCATPTLLFTVILLLATILLVVAVRRLATGTSGAALIKPWVILAAALIVGGLTQGVADTAAIQALREQYHPSIGFNSTLTTAIFAMPWPTLAFGFLAAALAAALRTRSTQHDATTSHQP
ncbi:hypothetical protein MRU69_15555 [Kocuria flava]|uniref:hypothetical protein n=1 Tax=Kocuria flava TaxID=446860 RepID=UPI001FF62938|nr:hypothetical protein [Kocuria flava]MCJ8506254.1 hypothetical protein [Kocuria flava]